MLIVSIGTEPIITPSTAGFYVADFVNGIYYINGVLSSEIDVVDNPSMIVGGKGLVVNSSEDVVFQPAFLAQVSDLEFTIIIEYETKGLLATDAAEILRLFNSADTAQKVSLYQGYGAESITQKLTLFSTYTARADQFIELPMPRSGRHIAAYSKSPNQANLSLSLDGKSQLQSTFVTTGPFTLDSGTSVVYQANAELVIRHIRVLPFVFTLSDLQTVASFNSPKPQNDNFASATLLADGDTLDGTTVAATSEISEPDHAGIVGGCSTWWRIDAAVDGTYTITISGDDVTNYMDPLIAVYTGTVVNALGIVASANGTTVSFTGAAGTTYHVAVDDHNGPTCGADYSINLTVASGDGPPPNDNFTNAITLTSGGTDVKSNVNASAEGSEQFHSGYAPTDGGIAGKTIWYKYTPIADETVTIETFGTYTDTFMTVWTGSALGSLTEVAFNDDSTPTRYGESMVSFSGTAGVTYYIQIDTYAGYEGEIRVNVNRSGIIYPPPPDYADQDTIYHPRTGNLYPSLVIADDLTFSPYVFNQTIFDSATVNAVTLSGGNLVATNTGTTSTSQHVDANKIIESGAGTNNYFEIQFTTIAGGASMRMGLRQSGTFGSGSQIMVYSDGSIRTGVSTWGNMGAISAGDWIAVATVFEAGGAGVGTYFRNVTQNGPWNGISGATAPDEFNSAPTGSFVNYVPFVAFGGTGGVAGSVFTANFGGAPFQGAIPAPRHQTSRPDNAPFAPGWF